MIRDITRKAVFLAIKEFDRLGKEAMLEKYGGGFSKRWYVRFGGKHYDQKLLLRAAQELSCLGPLPAGRGTFTAGQARRHLKRLCFEVVDPK